MAPKAWRLAREAAVSRDDVRVGMEELGVDPTEHIERCIAAIGEAADRVLPTPGA